MVQRVDKSNGKKNERRFQRYRATHLPMRVCVENYNFISMHEVNDKKMNEMNPPPISQSLIAAYLWNCV